MGMPWDSFGCFSNYVTICWLRCREREYSNIVQKIGDTPKWFRMTIFNHGFWGTPFALIFCPKDSCGVSRGFRRQLRSVIFLGAKERRSEFPNISQAHHGSRLSTWPYLWSRQFYCLMVGAAMPWHDVCGLSGKNFYGAPWLTQLGQILPICTVLIPKPAIWDPKNNQ